MILNPKTAQAAAAYSRAIATCSRSPRANPFVEYLTTPIPGTAIWPSAIPLIIAACAYTVAFFARAHAMPQVSNWSLLLTLLSICVCALIVIARAIDTALGIPAWLSNGPKRAEQVEIARKRLASDWPKDQTVLRTDLRILEFRQKAYLMPLVGVPLIPAYFSKIHDVLPPFVAFAHAHPVGTELYILGYVFIAIAGAMVASRDRELIFILKAKLKIA